MHAVRADGTAAALKPAARDADNPQEAPSYTTLHVFSPALRAALTSVTGALFFVARDESEWPRRIATFVARLSSHWRWHRIPRSWVAA
jgi:hypothetical protein